MPYTRQWEHFRFIQDDARPHRKAEVFHYLNILMIVLLTFIIASIQYVAWISLPNISAVIKNLPAVTVKP